jgi:hypothetical protein
MNMNIELFPAEKTCEQGCTHCPLARKDREFTSATEVDKEVQESFSVLEKALWRHSVPYDLHTTSSLHLFPSLKHPELIRMSRFETGKEIKEPGNQKYFSENIRGLLENYKINPKVIGFSVVPMYPVISNEDATVINQIIREISSWHFNKPYKSIQVTVRSNLIEPSLFKIVSPFLFDADKLHLKKIMHEYTSLTKWKTRAPFYKDYLYCSEYIGNAGSRKLEITNRVIMKKEIKDTPDAYYAQAVEHCAMARHLLDFAIAPKGIMLIHTSLAINNPILWVSHTDFRNTLGREMRKSKPSFRKMTRSIISANAVMYKHIQKYKKEDAIISHDMYMAFYEKNRPKYFK